MNEKTNAQALVDAVPTRVIRVAACLAERYANPEVAAFGRLRGGAEYQMWSGKFRRTATSERRNIFWRTVAGVLVDAYVRYGRSPTNYEATMRRAIENARATLAQGGAR